MNENNKYKYIAAHTEQKDPLMPLIGNSFDGLEHYSPIWHMLAVQLSLTFCVRKLRLNYFDVFRMCEKSRSKSRRNGGRKRKKK